MKQEEEGVYEIGNLRLNAVQRLLFKDNGDPLPLTPKALEILIHLVKNSGRVVEKDELMSAIWPDTVVEENNLTQNIATLRRVLGEKHGENRFIATVPGRGYKFVAPVRQVSGASGRMVETQAPELPSEQKGRIWAALLASALVLGFLWLIFLGLPGTADRTPEATIRSVAVLPFKPLVAEHGNETMELGMADSLIAKLSASEGLVVRPLSAVRRFAALDQDPLAAGRALAVEAVLDGSIQLSEDRMRVSSRLLRVSDGTQLWAEQFDEKRTDVFGVQDAITEKVAAALSVRLSGVRHPETSNLEAYENYMLGRLHALRLVQPEVEKGISYFERAIEIDPNYALGYVGIAEAQIPLALSNDVDPRSVFPHAKRAAMQAVELDPNLAAAHLASGMIAFWYDWDWPEAEKRFLRALELNPNDPRGRSMYAHLLSNTGRHDAALAEAQRARELDPASVWGRSLEGLFLQQAGRTETAVEHLRRAVDLEPRFWLARHFLSGSLIEKGMYEEAAREAEAAGELSPLQTHSDAFRGVALARHGRPAEACAVMDELLQASRERYVPPTHIGMLCAALGEREKALEQLEKAFAEKDVRLVFLKVEPRWDSLRSDARFSDLMKRMNLQ